MASLEIKVKLADLPDTLSEMREWLDRHKSNITQFTSNTDEDRIVTIRVGFNDGDGNADKFQRRFGRENGNGAATKFA